MSLTSQRRTFIVRCISQMSCTICISPLRMEPRVRRTTRSPFQNKIFVSITVAVGYSRWPSTTQARRKSLNRIKDSSDRADRAGYDQIDRRNLDVCVLPLLGIYRNFWFCEGLCNHLEITSISQKWVRGFKADFLYIPKSNRWAG